MGYNALTSRYQVWADAVCPPLRELYAEMLVDRLPPGSHVLEIGCGPGIPVAALLAAHFEVTGVDISQEMVRRAQQHVPAGHFEVVDISVMECDDGSFDAVVAFHSLIHLPRHLHGAIFTRIFGWLSPGGLFVASLGACDLPEGTEADWLGGGPMYWSTHDAETNRLFLQDAGFTIEHADVLRQVEPLDNEVAFLWVVASKPG